MEESPQYAIDQKTVSQHETPRLDTFHILLYELNARGHWYGCQLWHIPLAYVGLITIIISQSVASGWMAISTSFFAAFVFGTFAWRHTVNI